MAAAAAAAKDAEEVEDLLNWLAPVGQVNGAPRGVADTAQAHLPAAAGGGEALQGGAAVPGPGRSLPRFYPTDIDGDSVPGARTPLSCSLVSG